MDQKSIEIVAIILISSIGGVIFSGFLPELLMFIAFVCATIGPLACIVFFIFGFYYYSAICAVVALVSIIFLILAAQF